MSGLTMDRHDKRLRSKNLALLGVLVGVVVLLYVIAIIRLGMQL